MLSKTIKFLLGLSALVSCQMFYGHAVQADDVDFLRKHCLLCHDAANHSGNLIATRCTPPPGISAIDTDTRGTTTIREHLTRFATGSEISFYDRAEIRRIASATEDHEYGLRSLVHAFAQSPLFLSLKVDNP